MLRKGQALLLAHDCNAKSPEMAELIITNGDAAGEMLAAAGVRSRIVAWRDVLHEGPLVPAASLAEFSSRRARYLSDRFGIPYAETRADLLTRDALVEAHMLFDTVTIWLEHDLYDQLQLIHIASFFHSAGRTAGLRLVQADDFLATQKPETILRFAEDAIDLDAERLATAAAFWQALTMPSPEALLAQLRSATGSFRFLRPALGRFIEELPATAGGLNRSERTVMAAIAGGGLTPRDVFGRLLSSEDAPFMGDWSAYRLIDDLAGAAEPLVSGLDRVFPTLGESAEIEAYLAAPLSVTAFGRSVLAGEADAIAVNGIDRWWAGTHLSGHDCWRWDARTRRLVPPGGAD